MDTTSYYNSSQALFNLSILLSLFAFIFFVIIVSALSGIVIRPFIRNYEKQRRFITNAGHALKTPLAIISANTELQELMTGENEWLKSTNDQVARLTNLINSLVALSRLEEQPDIVAEVQDDPGMRRGGTRADRGEVGVSGQQIGPAHVGGGAVA